VDYSLTPIRDQDEPRHDRLYRSGNLATIDFSVHLRELTALITRGQSNAPERIRLVVESDSVKVNLDTAIPLGLIAAELITNAYKHWFVIQLASSAKVSDFEV
jgi:two-component sensor histidine kinase